MKSPTDSDTIRTPYRPAGQIVAVQTKEGMAAGTFYYTYTDYLGNVTVLSWSGETFVSGSQAHYDPCGLMTSCPMSNP